MASPAQAISCWAAAGLVPLVVTIGATQLAYWSGNYPHASPLAHVGIGVGTVLGAAFFWRVANGPVAQRLVVLGGYLAVTVVVCYFIEFMVGCSNGDCL
jgi:uncharacterized membrane protein (DUF441 family)